MTQKWLGMAAGFDEKTADVRIVMTQQLGEDVTQLLEV